MIPEVERRDVTSVFDSWGRDLTRLEPRVVLGELGAADADAIADWSRDEDFC